MKPDLKLGRELAQKATKGEWKWYPINYYDGLKLVTRRLMGPLINYNAPSEDKIGAQADCDYSHICHHSGKTMIQIYDYIEELEKLIHGLSQHVNDLSNRNMELLTTRLPGLIKKISTLEAQNKVMEEALKETTAHLLKQRIFDNTHGNHTHVLEFMWITDALSRVEEMRKK